MLSPIDIAVKKKEEKNVNTGTRDINDDGNNLSFCCIFVAINRLSVSRCADKICVYIILVYWAHCSGSLDIYMFFSVKP